MKRKSIISVVIVILIIGVAVGLIYLKGVNDYKQKVENISIGQINLEDVPDGVYIGACDVNYISAKVEVNVKSGKMESIRLLEYKHDRGAAAVTIIDDMVKEQKISVDTVSGATNSSKVIQKAVENALMSSPT